MSIDIENWIDDSVAERVTSPYIGAIRLVAGQVRALQTLVGEDPLEENTAHGEVWNIRSSAVKKLKKMYVWIIKPDDVA